MSKTVLTITFICIILAYINHGESIPQLDGRIIGGTNVRIEDHPHQISLRYLNSHICGGFIIAPKFVVTAAHCTDGVVASQLSIRAGSSLVDFGGTTVAISAIYQNANYNRITFDFDISILLLDGALEFSKTIQGTALASSGEIIPINSTASVTGWGITVENSTTLSQTLQGVSLLVVDIEECRRAYGASAVTDRMICAYYPRRDACQGDSGGPLRINGRTVGIVSWGTGCARSGFPGVYTNVAAVRNFIRSITGV